MMAHRGGPPPISTIGLGRIEVSSLSRVPRPPARIMAFTHTTGSRLLMLRKTSVTAKTSVTWSRPSCGMASRAVWLVDAAVWQHELPADRRLRAGFDCFVLTGKRNRSVLRSGAAEGEVFVAEVAGGDGDDGEDSRREVGGELMPRDPVLEQERDGRQQGEGEDHAAAIDGEAAQPFAQVVAAGPEDKPLVSEEGCGHGDDVRE